MHELAKLAMRGPRQAILLASVSMLIPMMFWFGAAVVALTTLRKGLSQGLNVYVWAAIPGLGWWFGMQDPGSFLVLTITLVMAIVLRLTVSWQNALAVGLGLSLLVGSLAHLLMPELIALLMDMTEQMSQKIAEQSQQEFDETFKEMFRALLVAGFASTFYALAVGSLCLARSWQSKLFNPGGWREEFHSLRLSAKFGLALVVGFSVFPLLGIDPALVLMVGLVPLIVCGLALVHGLIAQKQLGKQWLLIFYITAVFLFQVVLVIVAMMALIDSVIDFRKKAQVS